MAKCDHYSCSNEARYITVDGARACGLCSLDLVAVRISDIPDLLRWARDAIKIGTPYEDRLRSLISGL